MFSYSRRIEEIIIEELCVLDSSESNSEYLLKTLISVLKNNIFADFYSNLPIFLLYLLTSSDW